MKILDTTQIVRQYCRINKRYALVFYIGDDYESFDELRVHMPILKGKWEERTYQAVSDGLLFVICKTRKEHDEIFGGVQDKDRLVYCWTCGPNGEILTENT